jgi:hypothetical protein
MMAPLVQEDKVLVEGRVQYITLHLLDNSKLTIINTYASRTSRSKAGPLCGEGLAKQTSHRITP